MTENINKKTRHFVVGDTHGCGKTVQNLMHKIKFDHKSDHVYFLGDYYDGESKKNVSNLFEYLNKYYQPDLNKTGFHLIRGNHEWGIKNNNNLNKIENKIKIKDLPDIILINNINNQKFALCHGGMHEEQWRKINNYYKNNKYSFSQLDISEKDNKSALYRAIIFPTKENDTNYDKSKDEAADFWPLKDNIKNVAFIHGHFPITLEKNMKENYNYQIIKDTKVRYNPIRQAYNIDSGVKKSNNEERSLTCVHLEKLDINGNGVYTVPYEEGLAKILDVTWNKLKDQIEKTFSKYNDNLRDFISALINISELTIDNLPSYKNSIALNLEKISRYIKNNNSYNTRLNNMFNLNDFTLPVDNTKEYYFFIADLKIQSTVYILRIYKFICSWEYTNSLEKRRTDFLNEVNNIELSLLRKLIETNDKADDYRALKDLININYIIENIQDNEQKLIDLYKEVTPDIITINSFHEEKDNDIIISLQNLTTVFETLKQQRLDQVTIKFKENGKEKIEEEFSKLPNFEYGIQLFKYSQNKFDFNSQNAIEYYLFDNSMKELEFCGIEWKWLWRYERNKRDLFRCVGTDNFSCNFEFQISNNSEKNINNRKYYSNMIRETVKHMNTGTNKPKLSSYSKNPFRDIYKYMDIKKNNNEQNNEYYFIVRKDNKDKYKSYLKSGTFEINDKSSDLLELPYEKNKNNVTFALIKNADTNIIREIKEVEEGIFSINGKNFTTIKYNSIYDFYTMITEKIFNEGYYGFCLDILDNKAPIQNNKIREVFQEYTDNFPYEEEKIKGLQRNIVSPDDKEVIMLGNTCDNIIYDLPNDYKTCKDNVEYRINMTSKEMLYLFYQIHKMYHSKIKIEVTENKNQEEKEFLKYNLCFRNGVIPIYVESEQLLEITEDIKVYEKNLKANIEKSIMESIKNKLEIYGDDQNTTKKIEVIKSFLINSVYYKNPNYGDGVYTRDNDIFIRFCKEIFLKSN